ncbi:hypothetical protein ACIQTU_12285 [Brevundimonas sp. NPDC090276]|uniref:hypothetical protein n=1 Tax=Brevundimonas sp. NPDC090276 TaxID=3363956 RepID=UPI00383A2CF4
MPTSTPFTSPAAALTEALRASSLLRDQADQPVSATQALVEARRASKRLRQAADPLDLGHTIPRSPEVEAALAETLRFAARLRAAGEGRAMTGGV